MPRFPRYSDRRGPVILVLGAVGCGSGDTSLTEPVPPLSLGCAVAAPSEIGAASLLPPAGDCLALGTARAGYALAHFDARFVEASRTRVESAVDGPDRYVVTVRRGADPVRPVASRVPTPVPDLFRDHLVRTSAAGAGAADECAFGPGFEVFCRTRPWSEGDTLTVPAPFGLFIDEAPRRVRIALVRGPFAFAAPIDLDDAGRERLRPLLRRLADVGTDRILPLVRHGLGERSVYTATGARQILVDVFADESPVCICGVAVGHFAGRAGVAGISIRFPIGPEFEADRIGLFAHELTHMWQHAHEVHRSAQPGSAYAPTTRWALEGGADLIRQEIMRGLAAEPLGSNLDPDTPAATSYLDRLLRNLRVASGRIRHGYGQTAGLLRHLYLEAAVGQGRYDAALAAVLQGSLEGWFGSPDPTFAGPGLSARLGEIVPGFEPVDAVLRYALANAVDDRTTRPSLQNRTVRDAWRKSAGSNFVPAVELTGPGGVTLSGEAGSVGYLYLEHDGVPARLALEADVEGVRWMIVRFH